MLQVKPALLMIHWRLPTSGLGVNFSRQGEGSSTFYRIVVFRDVRELAKPINHFYRNDAELFRWIRLTLGDVEAGRIEVPS